jgi:DNA polymerase
MSEEKLPTAKKKAKKEEKTPLHSFTGTKMDQLKQLWDSGWYGCKRCSLCETRTGKNGDLSDDIVFADGNPEAKIMFVGEAPGEEEAARGIPFVGASGRLMNQILATVSDDTGIQELFRWINTGRHNSDDQEHFHKMMLEWRQKEFFFTNVVACHPIDNRVPTNAEIKACWERVLNIIYIVDPWLIIASGKTAIEVLVRKKIEVTKMRGHIFDVEIQGHLTSYRVPAIATLHPSYLLRQADWKEKGGTYMQTVRDYMEAMVYVDRMKNLYHGTAIPHRITIPK